jgi:polysaccharide deacetylase 2 family uncharacterized protein YibQ
MPLPIQNQAPTLVIRREAFERAELTRESVDRALTLTADEFRVERDLIAIGPVHDDAALAALVQELEHRGLAYFDDFFELTGNWPDWLSLFAMGRAGGPPTGA